MLLGELVELDGATEEARGLFTAALGCLARVADDPLGPLHEADVRTRLAHAYRREGQLEPAERRSVARSSCTARPSTPKICRWCSTRRG
ncbi:hypothetical protein OV079_51020 [Nannocystis pusilla]|uniref:Tetratricopeptide repeat protein n=1 Tax=Nannocystis pusilla TaxID=889268 RepID=A0A9X3F0V3_9BACT|nr:hypothetical protein [Nannocystis pusilla]MCY1013726.1 hypothetical protein [Nannocystis pusilla]